MPEGGSHSRCAVILTAIQVEYQAVRAHLTDVIEDVDHLLGTVYERGTFLSQGGVWDVGIVEVGAGIADAALAADRAINHFNPILVLFVGVAGGLKDVVIGDVVAATKVYGYASGKARTTFEARPDVSISTFRMVQRARAEARRKDWLQRLMRPIPDPPPRAYVAPIASGDQVVASTDSALYHFLLESYSDAIAVEMEGHGFLHAAQAHPQVNALIIRGISDLIDGKRESDAKKFQALAARHASAFAFEVLAKLDVTELQHDRHLVKAPASTEHQQAETNQHRTMSQEEPVTISPETIINGLLHEFRAAIPGHHTKLKITYDLFGTGKDIYPGRCESAVKSLDSVDFNVQKLRKDAPTLSLFDKTRLVDIHDQISALKLELQLFRSLRRPLKTTSEKREYQSKRERIRSKYETLLMSLEQFNNN